MPTSRSWSQSSQAQVAAFSRGKLIGCILRFETNHGLGSVHCLVHPRIIPSNVQSLSSEGTKAPKGNRFPAFFLTSRLASVSRRHTRYLSQTIDHSRKRNTFRFFIIRNSCYLIYVFLFFFFGSEDNLIRRFYCVWRMIWLAVFSISNRRIIFRGVAIGRMS